MNYSKRHGEILRVLQDEGTVTIASLAERLGVSLETVRRDVKPLTRNGKVLKMHGAVGLPSVAGEAPFDKRMREQADAKRAIARAMAATIRDGESVMLDTGTTTSFLARELLGVDMSKQQQSSDWAAAKLSESQLAYAASDVLYLHQLKDKLDAMLAREGRTELAQAAFRFLPARAKLDLAGFGEIDILSH